MYICVTNVLQYKVEVMKTAKASVYLDEKRPKTNGLCSVKIKITYNRKRKYFGVFEDIEFAMGKYYIYKIELVHVLDKNLQLPLKNKSVVFWISTNPNKKHPIKLDQIIHEYHNILLLVK